MNPSDSGNPTSRTFPRMYTRSRPCLHSPAKRVAMRRSLRLFHALCHVHCYRSRDNVLRTECKSITVNNGLRFSCWGCTERQNYNLHSTRLSAWRFRAQIDSNAHNIYIYHWWFIFWTTVDWRFFSHLEFSDETLGENLPTEKQTQSRSGSDASVKNRRIVTAVAGHNLFALLRDDEGQIVACVLLRRGSRSQFTELGRRDACTQKCTAPGINESDLAYPFSRENRLLTLDRASGISREKQRVHANTRSNRHAMFMPLICYAWRDPETAALLWAIFTHSQFHGISGVDRCESGSSRL